MQNDNPKLKIILIIFLIFVIAAVIIVYLCQHNNKNMQDLKNQNIRQPAMAGQFYPADKKELAAVIDNYLRQAEQTLSTSSGQAATVNTPRIIIVPHAGYIYSGRVAAYAFKAVQGLDIERVVLIGRSHQQFFNTVIADGSDVWQTPLGVVAVDKDFILRLANFSAWLKIDAQPHQTEHSLEVEIPFLQKIFGNNIAIVPLLFGDDNLETAAELADILARFIDDKTLVVISSDLSHYPPYNIADELDQKTIETILGLGIDKLHRQNTEAENADLNGVATLVCAEPAIITAMALAKKFGLKPELLKYANSGDYFSETKDRVVGYAAISFYFQNGKGLGFTNLNEEEQKIALQIARETLVAAFEQNDYQLSASLPEIFQEKRGVFVTLKKQQELRGCIGNFSTNFILAENIKEMALAAAFEDTRFAALEKEELKDIEIEISVLSPMQRITDPNVIELGKHGVYVRQGNRSGVYLPQVASEAGWSKEEFLNSLCEHKAGMNRDCWKDGSTEVYIFTAQTFGE